MGQINLSKKHKEEIKEVISERGGQIEHIEKVSLELSPFAESNKSNVIYKIFYKKDGNEFISWYRGVKVPSNIHARNPTAIEDRFNEEWIFRDDN